MGEEALLSTILKRSSILRMTSVSFCHVDQLGGECVSLAIPEIRLWVEFIVVGKEIQEIWRRRGTQIPAQILAQTCVQINTD